MRALGTRAAGVLAALAIIGAAWLTLHEHDKHVAQAALAHQQLAAAVARGDSAKQASTLHAEREAHWHARADSLARLRHADSLHLDSLSRRITITAPGVIAISQPTPTDSQTGSTRVVDTVTVPRVVTDYIAGLERQNASLHAALMVADSGWAAADSVAAARARQIAALNDQVATLTRIKQPRLGVKTGVVLGVLTAAGAVWLGSKLQHRAAPTDPVRIVHGVQLGASVRVWP